MKKYFLFLLLSAVLLTGCADRTKVENGLSGSSSAAVSTPAENSEQISSEPVSAIDESSQEMEQSSEWLLEEFIIPYEAISGGSEVMSEQMMAAFSFYRALVETGLSGEEGIPRQTVNEYGRKLFGLELPAAPCEIDWSWVDDLEASSILYEEYYDGLLRYSEEQDVYTSEFLTDDIRPLYEVVLKDIQEEGNHFILRVGRSLDGYEFPDVSYAFTYLPECGWRFDTLHPELTEEFTQISTPEQLVRFSKMVNSGDRTYLSNTITLTADIDMAGVEMEPIGRVERHTLQGYNAFAGGFDGQKHIISNLSMDRSAYEISDGNPTGLFGETSVTAVVQNLHLRDVSIRGGSNTAGIAGNFSGRMYHCSVTGTVEGFASVGGIAGFTSGGVEMVDCHADVSVSGVNGVGGLCGDARNGWYEACTASGTVTAVTDPRNPDVPPQIVGGFAGYQQGSVIRLCFSDADVRTETFSNMVGNFIGLSEYATTARSYVSADVGGSWDAVDDDHGGVVDVEVVPREEYDRLITETIPENGTYTKNNGVYANLYNSKVDLVGAVDFTENTLAALIYNPTEKILTNCQDYLTYGGDSGKLLLVPIREGTKMELFITDSTSDDPWELYNSGWSVMEDDGDWGRLGQAFLFNLEEAFSTGKKAVIRLDYSFLTALYVVEPDSYGEMTYVYIDAE